MNQQSISFNFKSNVETYFVSGLANLHEDGDVSFEIEKVLHDKNDVLTVLKDFEVMDGINDMAQVMADMAFNYRIEADAERELELQG